MIQFNLLPDVKMQYLKAKRAKQLVIAVSTLVSIASFVIFVLLLLFVDVAQKKQLSDLTNNITSNTAELSSNTNLNKILTVQSQLNSLPQIEAQDPAASRLFGYINELTPSSASITSLQVNFSANDFSITGTADSLNTVNQFVDAIKFTTFNVKGSSQSGDAFNTVVLSSFGYSNSNETAASSQPATFTITFNYNPIIFNNTDNVSLTVPSEVTTRSVIAQPTDLFVKAATTTSTGGGQ